MFLNVKKRRSRRRCSNTLKPSLLSLMFVAILSTILILVAGANGSDIDEDITTIPSDLLPLTQRSSILAPAFKFKHSVYNASIPENSVGRTYLVQPPFDDIMGIWHQGILNSTELDIKFRIIYGDKEKIFKAEDRTVGDFTFLAIRTRTGNIVLNREKVDQYRLKIRATITRRDATSKTSIEDECSVNVNVLDTNDLNPFFYPNEYSVTVPEDTAVHQSIVKVIAEDADTGINGEIYYSFLEDNDWFSVHPTSGVITLTRPLKYVDKSSHELIVIATDRGGIFSNRLSQPSKAKVKIRVKQVSICLLVV